MPTGARDKASANAGQFRIQVASESIEACPDATLSKPPWQLATFPATDSIDAAYNAYCSSIGTVA